MRRLALLFALPAVAFSQDKPPIQPDRPGFSDGTGIVGKRTLEVETGKSSSFDSGHPTLSWGDAVLRYGLGGNLELRIVGITYLMVPGGAKGWGDPGFGFKYRLVPAGKGRPDVSFIGLTTVPVGASDVRDNEWNPTIKLAWNLPTGDDAVYGNLVWSRVGSGAERFGQSAMSLGYGHAFNDRDGVGLEVWWIDHTSLDGPGAGFAGISFTHLLNPNIQLDIELQTGLDQHKDGYLFSTGIAVRF
jgi:hypothetical protein